MLGLGRNNSLILLGMFFWGCGEGLWLYIQPLYVKSLGANPMEIGLVLSVAPVLMVVGFIPMGILADRYGRKTIMVAGACVGAVAVLMLAFVTDWRQSIVWFLLYFGSGCSLPAVHAYVAHESSGKSLNRIFSLLYAAFSVGLIFFPTVGGWMAGAMGYRSVLSMAAIFYSLSAVASLLVTRQPVGPKATGFGFGEVLSNRRLLALCAVNVFIFVALFLGQPFAPNYLQEVVGVDLFWIGFLGSVHALGATVLGVALGRISEGIGGLILGQGLVLVSLPIFLRFRAIPLLTVSFFLRGAFNASKALALAQPGKVLGEASTGLAYGLFNTAINVSWVVAPYLAAWLYTSRPDLPFLVSAAMIAVMMVVSSVVLRDNTG